MRALQVLIVCVLLALPTVLSGSYLLHLMITTGLFIIAAMSLNLVFGYTGQLSLGHIAFFGIGAYVSALCSLGFNVPITDGFSLSVSPKPVWLSFLFAMAVSGLFGWLIGKVSFKIRGAYFVIVSISFAEVVRLVALNWVSVTQGPMALNNIPPFDLPIPGLDINFYGKVQNYYLILVLGIVAYVVISRLVRSRVGHAMVALRENESLASSVGIDVTHYLVLGAVVSAAIAGGAGSLYAHYIRIIDPDIFLFIYTVTMIIMIVTGGKGTLAGPLVGGVIFGALPPLLREVAEPEVQWIIYGALMIAVVFFMPEGIVPAVQRTLARYRFSGPASSGAAAPSEGQR
jgi:branched-chain amino acid transport system permease protein